MQIRLDHLDPRGWACEAILRPSLRADFNEPETGVDVRRGNGTVGQKGEG